MKTCKTVLSVVLATLILAGNCLAADVSEEQIVHPLTAIALSEASGAVLSNAQEDLAEIQRHSSSTTRSVQPFNADSVMIYDCGTQTVSDYDISTTLYTFDSEAARSSGTVGGMSVHTYTQSGFVRFKVYFMILFSYDGTNVSPIWTENSTWTSTDDAILYCGTPVDSYAILTNTCTVRWSYYVKYGTSTTPINTAYMMCTKTGAVTIDEDTIAFT